MLRRNTLAIVVVILCVAVSPAAERFTGMLSNGDRIDGKDVGPWFAKDSQPKLGNHKLLDPGNHVRWLRDNALPGGSPPEAFVEFVGGDRLPGMVMAYRTGGESPFDRQPPHLVVDHPERYDWPRTKRETVRVTTRWLRRIVWAARGSDRYRPGTAFARDGRQIRFKSLRFEPTRVRLLLSDGTMNVPFSQLAELHLRRQDPWNAYYEQLAVLSPDGEARLVRLETSDGLIATGSAERFQAQVHGSHNPDNWYHMVQPAWSLSPIWVRFRTIHLRRYSLPHQVPLSDVELTAAGPGGDGSHWHWQRDRNVRGGLLRCDDDDYGWGLGVHAPSRLRIPLPAAARAIRTKIGLDQIVGGGGCARALVYLGEDASRRLYRSDLLIGSDKVLSPSPLNLPGGNVGSAESRMLTLVVDPAHGDRPRGADPLNIRDMVDWLEPELELDAGLVKREIRRRAVDTITAWRDWAIEGNDESPIELFNRWDDTDPKRPAYRLEVLSRPQRLTLSRTVQLNKTDRWLALAVSRFAQDTDRSQIEVRVNGRQLGRENVPTRNPGAGDPEPLLFSLAAVRGQKAKIDITAVRSGGKSKVDWRGIAISQYRPGLRPLFEEQENFAKALRAGDGTAAIEAQDRHTGTRSLKITPPDKGGARLPGLPAAIRERPRLGEFRYLRFAWKKRGGRLVRLQIGHHGRFGPEEPGNDDPRQSFRYDAGPGETDDGGSIRLARSVPSDWVVVTRDLYADFGEFTFTGLSFDAIDGQHALFDHIYLGRTLNDFQRIEVSAP